MRIDVRFRIQRLNLLSINRCRFILNNPTPSGAQALMADLWQTEQLIIAIDDGAFRHGRGKFSFGLQLENIWL